MPELFCEQDELQLRESLAIAICMTAYVGRSRFSDPSSLSAVLLKCEQTAAIALAIFLNNGPFMFLLRIKFDPNA